MTSTIFDEGFSTRDTATTLSGRGVGMGIVRAAAERMGGTVEVSSVPGQGTKITIDVPVSIATMRVVLVEVGGVILGVPSAFVVRVGRADPRKLARVDGRAMLVTQERPFPSRRSRRCSVRPSSRRRHRRCCSSWCSRAADNVWRWWSTTCWMSASSCCGRWSTPAAPPTNATVGTALLGTGVVALVLSVPALLAHSDGRATGSSDALAAASDEPRAPARILVVDDSITSRTLEQSVLAAAGYDVVTAVDGAEAWRTIERQEFALVVSDVEMPHLDGFGLCARIRANPRTATLPVILVTSLDEPAQRARGLEAGADAYITKSSFDQDTLLDTVRMLIDRSVATEAPCSCLCG